MQKKLNDFDLKKKILLLFAMLLYIFLLYFARKILSNYGFPLYKIVIIGYSSILVLFLPIAVEFYYYENNLKKTINIFLRIIISIAVGIGIYYGFVVFGERWIDESKKFQRHSDFYEMIVCLIVAIVGGGIVVAVTVIDFISNILKKKQEP